MFSLFKSVFLSCALVVLHASIVSAQSDALMTQSYDDETLCGVSDFNWFVGTQQSSEINGRDQALIATVSVEEGAVSTTAFYVSDKVEVRLEALGENNADLMLALRNESGMRIIEDDDSGGNGAPLAEIMLDEGVYCLQAWQYSKEATTMTVSVGLLSHLSITDLPSSGAETETQPVAEGDSVVCGDYAAEWIGEGQEDSIITGRDEALTKSVSIPEGGENSTAFYLEESTRIRLEALGDNNSDVVLALKDVNGNWLAEDDDSGGSGAAMTEVTLDPGTYCLHTRQYSYEPARATISVGLMDHERITSGVDNGGAQVEACTSETDAFSLAEGAIDGQLSDGGITLANSAAEVPYYRFTLENDTPITIKAGGLSADPYLFLYDANGMLLAENDDYESRDARIDMPDGLAAGEYCIGMRALSDEYAAITFALEQYDPMEAMERMFKQGLASPPLDGSYPVEEIGLLSGSKRLDIPRAGSAVWYSFEVDTAGVVIIEAIAAGNVIPQLSAFDELGRPIQLDSAHDTMIETGFSTANMPAILALRVVPGKYMFAAYESRTNNEGLTLGAMRILIEKFVSEGDKPSETTE